MTTYRIHSRATGWPGVELVDVVVAGTGDCGRTGRADGATCEDRLMVILPVEVDGSERG